MSGTIETVRDLSNSIGWYRQKLTSRRRTLIKRACRDVRCPQCGAPPRKPCLNTKTVKQPHKQRVAASGITDPASGNPRAAHLSETIRALETAERDSQKISALLRRLKTGKVHGLPNNFESLTQKYGPPGTPVDIRRPTTTITQKRTLS